MSAAPILKPNGFESVISFVSQLVSKEAGIILGDKQKVMVETRVKSRMLQLGIDQASLYLHYIKEHFNEEKEVLVSLLTTHHTFFFREFGHFESLLNQLPRLIQGARSEGRKDIHVWSAACSRGQEVYSIAMFLDYHLKQLAPDFSFKIFGSDIDGTSVEYAKNGVYRKKEVESVPLKYLSNHWIKGTGDISDFVKIRKDIASRCSYKKVNLLEVLPAQIPMKFDVIFLRNVLIYFEEEKVNQIAKNVLRHMNSGGLLIVGTSETLSESALNVKRIEPNIFSDKKPVSEVSNTKAPEVKLGNQPGRKLRVMCVDDSSAVIKLLGKILTSDKGFEVVATASNGKEAIEKLKTVNVDVMTLDIHMPEMDGLTYLNQQMSKNHPPVVMISSASRADADSALRALKLGASDFVEKPSLENLSTRADEIRAKLKTSFAFKSSDHTPSSMDLELSKKLNVVAPESKLLGIVVSAGQVDALISYLQELKVHKIPTLVMLEGQDNYMEALVSEWNRRSGLNFKSYDSSSSLSPGDLAITSFKSGMTGIKSLKFPEKLVSVWGGCSESAERDLCSSGISIISLELDAVPQGVRKLARHVVTPASMAYHTKQHFSK